MRFRRGDRGSVRSRLYGKFETKAIKAVFGDNASRLPVSSTRLMPGHLLGAAGGLEAVIRALAIRNGLVAPAINCEFPDPEYDLDYIPDQARPAKLKLVLSSACRFGGHNVSLIFLEPR